MLRNNACWSSFMPSEFSRSILSSSYSDPSIKYQQTNSNSVQTPSILHCRRGCTALLAKIMTTFVINFMFYQRKGRSCSYAHPLAGTTYHNSQFTSQCSSFLDTDIKLSTHASTDHQEHPKTATHRLRVTRHAQSVVQPQGNHHLMGRTQALSSHLSDRPTRPHHEQPKRLGRKRTLKRKLAINPYVDGYLFPSLDIRIIHRVTSISDLDKQTITYNFQPIFRRLIRMQLMGEFTSNFVFRVEPYIRDIVANRGEQEEQMAEGWKSISRKEDLLDLMAELQAEGQVQKVRQLVRYYCFPSVETSQSILSELLEELVIQIYEKKNCSKDLEYCLLLEDGHRVVHISQISFSTRILLIVPSASIESSLSKYQRVLEEHDRQQRMTFKQSIRHHFISKIVKQQIDSASVNYHPQPKEHHSQRREIVELAEEMIESRSKLRLSRAGDSRKEDFSLRLEDIKEDYFLKREDSRRKTTGYGWRRCQVRKEYKQIIDKLHRILDPSVKYPVRSHLDTRTETQFASLHCLNDKYDITFTHSSSNSNKLLFKNVLENCCVFNTKTPLQLKRIIAMLRRVYGREETTELDFWQFKEIYQTAHGVAEPPLIMKFVLTYLQFDEWGELGKQAMFLTMQEAVPYRGRPLQLIQSIIWNWLQRCKLIENEALRRRNIEIWYEPVRVVYLLFLSIIFGTQYQSFEDMLAEMIKYEFY